MSTCTGWGNRYEVKLGQEVKLEVLHPPVDPLLGTASDPDNNALVLRLSYGQVSFLLAADLQRGGEVVS